MTDTSLAFDIFTRDHGSARAFRRVSDEMDGVRDSSGRLRRDTAQLSRATDELARSETSMGLAARQAGIKVEEAMMRAAAARRRAEQAAERLARGEIDEAEAARLTERAERALEKATLAAAVASQAAARAADRHAEELRELARASVLAGTAERGMFSLIQRSGTQATGAVSKGLASLGEMGPASIVPLVAAIAALPVVAIAASGAVTLGLGGAMAALGITSAAKSKEVSAAWSAVADNAKGQVATWSAPWKPALVGIAHDFDKTVGEFNLGPIFEEMAPAVQGFAHDASASLLELRPALTATGHGFDQILGDLGPELPGIMANVSSGIESMANTAGEHSAEITQLAMALGQLVDWTGKTVSVLADIAPVVNPVIGVMDLFGTGAHQTGTWIDFAGNSATATGGKFRDLGVAAQSTAAATKALDQAMNSLLNPSLAVFNDTTQLKDGMLSLQAALRKSHGEMSLQTAASRAARTAFTGQISTVASLGQHTLALTNSREKERLAVARQLPGLYALAGSNRSAKAQVDALAKTFEINANSAGSARAEIKRLKAQIDALHSKDVYVTTHYTGTTRAEKGMGGGQALGGYMGQGYRAGGLTHALGRGYATAGYVTGPGTGTSDSIYAPWLSNGEYVIRSANVAKNRAALDAANYHGAQLVVASKAWSKASVKASPWGTASIKPPAAKKPTAQSASVPGMPYWWRGQADTAFGPGRAHFAWGSARPDMAASVTGVTPAKPASPWSQASVKPAQLKPAQLVIRADGSKAANAVVALLRDAIKDGGGDVQKFLGVSS